MANTYDIGDVARCLAEFRNATGLGADPLVVTFIVLDPSGAETTYVYVTDPEVVRTGLGDYYLDVPVDQDGVWLVRCEGTATNEAADDIFFIVRPSGLA